MSLSINGRSIDLVASAQQGAVTPQTIATPYAELTPALAIRQGVNTADALAPKGC